MDEDTLVTMHFARIRPPHSLLPWVLTAGGVVAGPALFGAPHTTRDLTLASVAIGLTALVIGFAVRHRRHHLGVPAPAGRRTHTLSWSPP